MHSRNADPKCTIIQRREKYKKYVKEHVFIKGDNYHHLRMCGVDPTPIGRLPWLVLFNHVTD